MTSSEDPRPDNAEAVNAEPALRDHRQQPTGSLPRFANLWVLFGLTTVLVLALVFAGHPTAPQPAPARSSRGGGDFNPGAVDQFRRQLEQTERELAEAQRALKAQRELDGHEQEQTEETSSSKSAADETRDGRERLKYTSLFAESLAFSRRSENVESSRDDREERLAKLVTDALTRPGVEPHDDGTPSDRRASAADEPPAVATGSSKRTASRARSDGYRLPEGTVIDSALMHLVDGELGGPVRCLVTAPVFAPRRDVVLVPAGSVVLGSAQQVTHGGQRRLAVAFHRIIRPDGSDVLLERAAAAGQRGEQGVVSDVDNHYWSTFGAAGAIGLVAGLAQSSARYGALDAGAGDVYRQGVASSLANSSMRVLDRYLNRLPSITVDEATPVKVVLMADVQIPAYSPER